MIINSYKSNPVLGYRQSELNGLKQPSLNSAGGTVLMKLLESSFPQLLEAN